MNSTRITIACILVTAAQSALAQDPTVLKHDGWVAAVAFAPDGKTLASGGADNVARLWEVGTWKAKGMLKGHKDCVCAVAFSLDGKQLASASYDHTAKMWEIATQHEVRKNTVPGVATAVVFADSVVFGRRTAHLLIGSVDGKVYSQDLSEFTPGWPLTTHRSWVTSLARDKDSHVASGSSDGTVRFGGPRFGRQEFIFEGGAGEVRCVAFSPDGKLLAAGNRYGTVRIWDVASRKEVKTITGHMGEVWSIAFSPDGKTLAAVDTEWKKASKVKLYDTTTWKERGSLACPGEILCIAYSPDGAWLAAGCWDKTVRLFSLKR